MQFLNAAVRLLDMPLGLVLALGQLDLDREWIRRCWYRATIRAAELG
jgi:hypothetical protein